jgi:hypothetical protein
MRIREALDTGAAVVATACPYCIRMLKAAVRELNVQNQIVVKDLAEILLQSVSVAAVAHTTGPLGVEIDQEGYHV